MIQVLLYVLAALCMVGWLIYLLRAAYHGASIKMLRLVPRAEVTNLPTVSIVVAARNEEALIERSLRSILASTYPNLEVVVVNDRSTDATGPVLTKIAAEDARVKPVHIEMLPEGWLGKVHALHTGVQHASGTWLLFTDADIHFEPEVVTRSIAYAERHALDQLCLLPDDRTQHRSFFLPLFVFAFGAMFLQRLRVKKVNEGTGDAFIGVGAFNLVRRSTFERTPGFEWLRMEVVDDVGVGYMIKGVGGKIAVLHGEQLLSFEWYPTLRDAIKGLEKNAFAGFARYSVFRGLASAIAMIALVVLPFIVTLAYGDIYGFLAVAFLYILVPVIGVLAVRSGASIKPIFAAGLPLGYIFVAFAILNSTLTGWREHGLRWRDTFYSLEALRAGRRIDL